MIVRAWPFISLRKETAPSTILNMFTQNGTYPQACAHQITVLKDKHFILNSNTIFSCDFRIIKLAKDLMVSSKTYIKLPYTKSDQRFAKDSVVIYSNWKWPFRILGRGLSDHQLLVPFNWSFWGLNLGPATSYEDYLLLPFKKVLSLVLFRRETLGGKHLSYCIAIFVMKAFQIRNDFKARDEKPKTVNMSDCPSIQRYIHSESWHSATGNHRDKNCWTSAGSITSN